MTIAIEAAAAAIQRIRRSARWRRRGLMPALRVSLGTAPA
jgi:hypothetical protein